MESDFVDKITELRSNAEAHLSNLIAYCEKKVNSTNKQLSNKNLTEIKDYIKQASSNYETAINLITEYKTKNDLLADKIEKILSNVDTKYSVTNPSFAQIVKIQESNHQNFIESNNNIDDTVLITAKENNSPTSVIVKATESIKGFRQKNKKFKINKLIKTKKGVVLKIPKDENIDNIITELKNDINLSAYASIYKQKKLDPVIVLKAVSKQTNLIDLPKIICDKNLNPELEGCINKMIVLFATKSNKDYHDVVMRVNPQVYDTIKSKGYIYTEFEKIIVKSKFLVRQCQKCFKFDHNTKQCNNDKLCIKCGHVDTVNHQCINYFHCHNCAVHPKYKNQDLNHPPNKLICPVYNDHQKNLINMTCFKGLDHDIIKTNRHILS